MGAVGSAVKGVAEAVAAPVVKPIAGLFEHVFKGKPHPGHAPVGPSQHEIAQLRAQQAELERVRAQLDKEKRKRAAENSAREEALRAREKALRQQEEAAAQMAAEQRRREEEARNYPVPDFLQQAGHAGKVNVAVVGNSGVGKSLFMNAVRRVKRGDADWAPVGVNETTTKPKMYAFPDEPRARLWDLPGAGTKLFPRETYIRTMGIRHFDVCVVITANRFTETETLLLEELRQFNVPSFTVRSKIDVDIENNKDDNGKSEDETKGEIANDLRRSRGIANPYLINNRETEQHDFPKLLRDVHAAIVAHRKYK